jgi:hypothetical protein
VRTCSEDKPARGRSGLGGRSGRPNGRINHLSAAQLRHSAFNPLNALGPLSPLSPLRPLSPRLGAGKRCTLPFRPLPE